MSVDRSIDPTKVEKREQRIGEDPVIAARQEEQRRSIQRPAKEYFQNTLVKAKKITHGLGVDLFGMPIIQTYNYLDKDFDHGIFLANKILMVYFLKCWHTNGALVIDEVDVTNQAKMTINDESWKYSLTDEHWVIVEHGSFF